MATNAAIVKRPVLELITASKTKFQGRLPEGMTVDRFMYGLATACQKNSALMNCRPESVILAAYEAAEVGCDLSPSLAQGWIIPYGDAAQFQPSYRFFIQRAYETGAVATFTAEVVYSNDHFVREFAPKRMLTHRPPADENRGEPIGAYALVEFKDGHFDWEYLTKEQIERHRKASKQPDSMMWSKFWEEGWRKTPIRVLAKRLPLTNPGLVKLAEAINRDAERDADPVIPGHVEVEPVPSAAQPAKEIPIVTESRGARVSVYIGKETTTIGGQKLRHQFSFEEMKPFGLKITDGVWSIPARLTSGFLELCGKKNVQAYEINEHGEPMGEIEEPSEEAVSAGLFEGQQ